MTTNSNVLISLLVFASLLISGFFLYWVSEETLVENVKETYFCR